ncbi:MAG: FAD-dependent oxidoreductase [Bacteroidota bacterium]
MDEKDIHKNFGFRKPAGLYSADGGEIDAYTFTQGMLNDLSKKNVPIYDHTEITGITHRKRSIELITAENRKITAKKLVIACGYESQKYLPKKVEKFFSTYAVVSEPSAGNHLV